MRLAFIYLPTSDLPASLALFRDTLGFDELWREGEQTVGLRIPDNEAALMLDGAAEPRWGPGPIFIVERVDDWHARHGDSLDMLAPPFDIPGGRMMGFNDPAGNPIYVMDQSTDSDGG
jgi:catechol 2,3-dioxygenase-like lactoylglutathione lyase family enzyme